MGEFDRSSKWLIEHFGGALLRLAGIEGVVSWRALQAELVQPGQLPDGLLEATIAGEAEPEQFVIEIATYPEQRLHEQLARDAMLVFLNRRAMPEVIALVLHPKGKFRPSSSVEFRSRRGSSRLLAGWRVIELWTLPAADLLAPRDPGLIPWVPLSRIDGPPEPVFEQCREIIEQEAEPEEQGNLLAVTQILARLRYNDPWIFQALGGRNAMIESPLVQEIVIEAEHRILVRFLRARFGGLPPGLEEEIGAVTEAEHLDSLIDWAGRCPDIESFRQRLHEDTP